MIRNFQQRQRLNPPVVPTPQMATIAAVSGQTARLTFSNGETSQKYYRALSAVTVGQRVKISKQSGTYIILGPV